MKYFGILAMWLGVYLLSKGLDSSGVGFFSIQAAWSLMLIIIGLAFYPSLFVVTLSTLELSAIIVHLGAAIGFAWETNLFYTQWEALLHRIDVMCIIAFIIWFPYSGALSGFLRAWDYIHAYLSKLFCGLSNRSST